MMLRVTPGPDRALAADLKEAAARERRPVSVMAALLLRAALDAVKEAPNATKPR